mgnify:CR=1 FL=1
MARFSKLVKPRDQRLIRLEVLRTQRLSPHWMRLTLGGGEIAHFEPLGFDQWFRLFLPLGGDHEVHSDFQLIAGTNRDLAREVAQRIAELEQELRASRDRFEVGDVTRTDVAQSEARLSVSQANLIAARGNAVFARQAYQRLVGRPPGQLDPLPPLPPLPADDAQALSRSAELNPVLAAARANERAAAEDVRAAKAGRMPSIGVQASANYNDYSNNRLGASGFDPRIGVTAGMPLFSGGLIAAQVRQAQARQSEALETISLTERQVTENVNNSWALLKTSEATITAANSSVRANTLASEGVRQENQVGSRDILDVLNAEQELLNSRVQLVQAERDRYVAAFQLLEAVGAADIALEGPGVQRYDPTVNARRVAGKGFAEFGYNPDPRKDTARDTAPITNPNLMGPQQ